MLLRCKQWRVMARDLDWPWRKVFVYPRELCWRTCPQKPSHRLLQAPGGPLHSASMKKPEQQPILSAAFGAAHAPQPRDHGSSE